MSRQRNVHGEGNYAASRKYNDAARRFARSGKVEEAAREAEPTSEAEALQMAAAEAEGRRRAKEEDPVLTRRPATPRAGNTSPSAAEPDSPDSATAPESPQAPRPGEQE
jgi:hypothetical protein